MRWMPGQYERYVISRGDVEIGDEAGIFMTKADLALYSNSIRPATRVHVSLSSCAQGTIEP